MEILMKSKVLLLIFRKKINKIDNKGGGATEHNKERHWAY